MRPNLPVGTRFLPDDQEVLNHYLKLKIEGKDDEVHSIIAEIDLCKKEPWELPEIANKLVSANKMKPSDDVWYFFYRPDYKNSKGKRVNRATNRGYWKRTGQPCKVKAKGSGEVIGRKRILTFQRKNGIGSSRPIENNWVIHEYSHANFDQENFVVCKLIKKAGTKTERLIHDRGESSSSMPLDVENPAANTEIADQLKRLVHDEATFLEHCGWLDSLQPTEQIFSDDNLLVTLSFGHNATAAASKVNSGEEERLADSLLTDPEMNEGLLRLNDEKTVVGTKQLQANFEASSASEQNVEQERSIQPADSLEARSLPGIYMATLVDGELPETRKHQTQPRALSRERYINCLTIDRDKELAERFTNLRINRELNANASNQVQYPKIEDSASCCISKAKEGKFSGAGVVVPRIRVRETKDNGSNYGPVHSRNRTVPRIGI